jgi:hypothetical protein
MNRADLPYRRLVIALSAFSGLSAIAGGIELLVWWRGSRFFPLELLRHTPFHTFVIPGVILAGVVGGTSLACCVLAWRRSRAAIDATIIAGAGLTIWIAAESAMFRQVVWLTFLYGGLGVTTLALGLHAGWRSGLPRHRWLIVVTAAEVVGFLVPAGAGIFSARAGLRGLPQTALVVAAGLFEGASLGAGQALAFPFRVRQGRYALLTALAAGLVWLCVMVPTVAFQGGGVGVFRGGPLALAIVAVGAIALAGLALAAIGGAQWIELRHHAPRAHRWIAWTALAWALALPLSFTPGPFVDEATPVASHLVLWACGGTLMAYVMANVTWQGLRRLTRGDRARPQRRESSVAHAIGGTPSRGLRIRKGTISESPHGLAAGVSERSVTRS